jgi:TonB family protein
MSWGLIVALAAICLMPSYGQVRLTPATAEELLIEKSDPVYPPLAKKTKLQGTVRADITISEGGVVISTEVINGHPLLITAAVDALKKRRYKPYLVNGKPVSFVSSVEIPFSLGVSQDEYELQQARTDRYIEEENRCQTLLKFSLWKQAEEACKAAVPLVDQLADHQWLTKMGAYEHVGYALLAQQRYQEALKYYDRAFEFAKLSLEETDAELGYAYRNLGMAHHGLRNLDKARKLYRKAEATLQAAHENVKSADLKQRYEIALKEILKYHLLAAEEAGDAAEVQDVKKRLEEKPRPNEN